MMKKDPMKNTPKGIIGKNLASTDYAHVGKKLLEFRHSSFGENGYKLDLNVRHVQSSVFHTSL